MLYQVSHGTKQFGADVIFSDVQFEIKGNEKITIVGRNGCGKTTFLRCMSGELNFDKGTVSMMNGTVIGYLAQKVLEHEERTVEEELRTVFGPVFALQKEMNEMEEQMITDHSEKLLMRYAQAQEKMEALNGYNWETEMKTVFTRFGFAPEDLSRPVGEFSGGQKTRIAFVKLLLSKPDILLLDEPTNHLDLETIEWLEGYVKKYPKAVVTVSHDRMFLDHTSDVVYDMEYGKMTRYTGNYSSYVEQKRNSLERKEAAYQRQQKDIQRLEELIEKFRYKKNKAAFAQSKIKYLDRMEKLDPVKGADDRSFHAHFTPRIKGGEKVLETDHLTVGYDHPLCSVTMEIRRGDRVGIIGPNGTGKSTLVKTLMELVPALSGSWLYGHQIEAGYFDQQLAQFSSGKTVLEELWDEYPDLDRTTVRSVLGQFLFSADDVFKTVDVLSGGEKVRLSLAKLLLKHSNFLILDEPTNHLDIPGKEALEESLKDYSGTILFVSHDRYFISQLANKLLILEDGTAKFFDMTYAEYEEMKQSQDESSVQTQKKEEKPVSRSQNLSPEGKRREIARLENKITEMEELLEEKRALRFEPEYYHDFRKMNELDEEIDDLHNELNHLYEQWEALSE
ncbi:MAG: ABC-F family ATP-binding cassette domain-containing protein [Erysipelotrichaceae bacterium]|nr:ABC-F family ATP-binding cassette domain-containing protein [Erysipelotrichaceae bacterium]